MIQEKTPPLTPALSEDEKFIESKLQKFTFTKEGLAELAEQFQDLIKQGTSAKQKDVYDARQVLKKNRVQIKKEGAALREFPNAFNRAVLDRERDLIVEIEPTEKQLEEIEDQIVEQKRKEKEEADRKEKLRLQTMVDRLAKVEAATDITVLMGMTDEQFEDYLKEATVEYQVILDKREADRIAEEKRKKEEEESLKKRQAEIKEEEKRLAAIRKEQEEIAAKQKEAQDKIDAENKRIADEKAKAEKAKKAMKDYLRNSRIESLEHYGFTAWSTVGDLAEMPLADYERLETIHKNAYEERVKEETRQREEKERQEAILRESDFEKLDRIFLQVSPIYDEISKWEMKSKDGREKMSNILGRLLSVVSITKNARG